MAGPPSPPRFRRTLFCVRCRHCLVSRILRYGLTCGPEAPDDSVFDGTAGNTGVGYESGHLCSHLLQATRSEERAALFLVPCLHMFLQASRSTSRRCNSFRRWCSLVLFSVIEAKYVLPSGVAFFLDYFSHVCRYAACGRRWSWDFLKYVITDTWNYAKWKIHFSSRRWTNKICWRRSETENIHLDTGPPNSRRKSRRFSWRIRRVSSTTSRLTSGCR